MARSQPAETVGDPAGDDSRVLRIEDEYLELDVASPREIGALRRLMGRVNGPAYPQPFLVEGPPGRFRLYVGEAAERVRTRAGIFS